MKLSLNILTCFWLFILLAIFSSCNETDSIQTDSVMTADDLHYCNRKVIELAMEDNFPPMIAHRVYTYPHLAAYMALSIFNPDELPPLDGKLNGLAELNLNIKKGTDPGLSALIAYCLTARKVVFSEHHMESLLEEIVSRARERGLNNSSIKQAQLIGESVAAHMIDWLNKDNYIETRTMDRFTPTYEHGEWRPTPPDYTSALESFWGEIRPMVIESKDIFEPMPLPKYDPSVKSDFYKMVYEVYEQSKELTEEEKNIAMYWDDNPNVTEHRGHLTVMIHKISPPGHWLNIASAVLKEQERDIYFSSKVYAYTCIAMFDGLISCWYEKYKTNLVRPITYIQEFIDVNWKPYIQTPPFPEYTSGHSVVSSAASTVLSSYLGKDVPFTDSTEVEFGLQPRTYPSFDSAAIEVGLSRFYGGIHYRQGIEEGYRQGVFIGNIVLEKLENE